MEVDEDIAFDVRICGIYVYSVVAAACKIVVRELGDRPGPLASGQVDDVVIT